jgi:hypothetical protein
VFSTRLVAPLSHFGNAFSNANACERVLHGLATVRTAAPNHKRLEVEGADYEVLRRSAYRLNLFKSQSDIHPVV